jgi:preprotein translocase SecE subunit
MAYKKDQGRMVRMATFWSIDILIFWGCRSLHAQLGSWFEALRRPIAGLHIPVLGIDVTPAVVIVTAVFAAGTFVLYRWTESPKVADLLIDTETELRKVTWPSPSEVLNSSLVVVVCVALLMGFMAGSDLILGRLARMLLFH